MSFFSIPTLRAFQAVTSAGCSYSTSSDANTILLLHGENFTDSSTNNYSITNTNVTSVSSPSKFCNSMSFNGSNAYLTLPIGGAANGLNTYTIEGWFYLSSTGTARAIISPVSSQGLVWFIRSDGTMTVGNNVSYAFNGTTTLAASTWHHLALVSDGTNLSIYANGSRDALGTAFALSSISQSFYLGNSTSFGGGASVFSGNIDEFRISNNTRYSGSTYTVPSTAFA